jgi:hypothetical protein
MGRVKRALLIAVAVIAVLAISTVVARWLGNDTSERAKVVELLRAQARGDAEKMLELVQCPDATCERLIRDNARKLRGRGELRIALYQSQTAHALKARTKPTRVVWFTPGRLTTVQCVLVRRSGTVIAGGSITLLGLSAPIGRESSCP